MMSSNPFNMFALVTLIAWVPMIFLLFALMTPRRAVIASFVIGYLFLPAIGLRFHTLPEINKVALTSLGVVLASFVFDGARLLTVRLRWTDLVFAVLMISPIVTSLSNDLGIMDGLSSFFTYLLRWGMAYWIGRAYFTDWTAVRELAMGIVMGAIACVPLCWWEIRMSPMLHGYIYGMIFESFRSDTYLFGVRLFGFRPNLFLVNGLTVTMFMGTSTVLAYWAWMTGSPKKMFGVPMILVVGTLFVTTVFCKAIGGVVLMALGMLVLTLVRWPKVRIPALLLMLAAPAYMLTRTTNMFSGDTLVDGAAILSRARSESLEFRIKNEDQLMDKALRRPLLGWGGWARSHVYDAENHDISIVDGLWILLLGDYGIIGLGAFTLLVGGSAISLWRNVPTRFWTDPACSAAVAIAVILGMYTVDSLFNATFSPVGALAVGATATIAGVARRTFARTPARPLPAAAAARMPAFVSTPKDIPYVYSPHRS